MSDADDGFDREAERRKLEEKYGDDDQRRASTQRMSDLLLKGATMTNSHCDTCGDPIFRQNGQEFCPTCSANAAGNGAEAADEEPATADNGGESSGQQTPAGGERWRRATTGGEWWRRATAGGGRHKRTTADSRRRRRPSRRWAVDTAVGRLRRCRPAGTVRRDGTVGTACRERCRRGAVAGRRRGAADGRWVHPPGSRRRRHRGDGWRGGRDSR